jgi:hypothetical protein
MASLWRVNNNEAESVLELKGDTCFFGQDEFCDVQLPENSIKAHITITSSGNVRVGRKRADDVKELMFSFPAGISHLY